jgi:hypothetical protein
MILLGHDESVAEWVGRQCGKPFTPPYSAIGVLDRGGTLRGGAVFNSYNGDQIEISLAGSAMVSRSAWRAILAYVFDQSGCKRLQVHTRKSNVRARRMLPKAGFFYEGTSRMWYGNEHGLCYSLTVSDLAQFRARWGL